MNRRPAVPLTDWYGWISIDEEGREAMVFHRTADGGHVPAFAPGLQAVEFFRPVAERCRDESGSRVMLVRWSARETLEELP